MLHLNESKQPVHMRYHLFLHYKWFLQNLGKDFIWTNMHTTVTPPPFYPQSFCYFHVKLLVVKGRWRINRFFEPLHCPTKKNTVLKRRKKKEHSKRYSVSILFLFLTIFSSMHKFVCTYLIRKVNITSFTNSLPTDSNLQKNNLHNSLFLISWLLQHSN